MPCESTPRRLAATSDSATICARASGTPPLTRSATEKSIKTEAGNRLSIIGLRSLCKFVPREADAAGARSHRGLCSALRFRRAQHAEAAAYYHEAIHQKAVI